MYVCVYLPVSCSRIARLAMAYVDTACVDLGPNDLSIRSQTSTVPSDLPMKKTPGRLGLHCAAVIVVDDCSYKINGPTYNLFNFVF